MSTHLSDFVFSIVFLAANLTVTFFRQNLFIKHFSVMIKPISYISRDERIDKKGSRTNGTSFKTLLEICDVNTYLTVETSKSQF